MLRLIFCCLTFILVITNANARWASLEDSSTRTIYEKTNINVFKDYTFEETNEFLDEILKEQGRDAFSKYMLTYDLKRMKIEILEAYTIFEGKKYVVGKHEIEDKPLASEANEIAEHGQVSIAFPKVVVGARIYLKYKVIVKKPALKQYFSDTLSFGRGGYFDKRDVTINSQVPLYIHANDPLKVLSVKHDKKIRDDKFVEKITINQIKPFTSDLVNEPSSGKINKKYLTWVSIVSENNWQDLHNKFSSKYLEVINQKLPPAFEKIYQDAKNQKNEIDQINYVTLNLNDLMNYLMDRSSVANNFFPRDLAKIAETQYGDCKDFSFATGAILKKLGYKVEIAIVYRGEVYPEFRAQIPNIGIFNHMMLKVTGKDGKVYWLDPTNVQSMAAGLFPDIADRMAMVISDKKATYEKIPPIDPVTSNINVVKTYDILGDEVKLLYEGNFTGQAVWNLNGLGKFYSKQMLEDLFFTNVNGGKFVNYEDRLSSKIPGLTSRIVGDVNLKLEYKANDLLLNTNLGEALKLKYETLYFLNNISDDDKVDFYIDQPTSYNVKTVIKSGCIKNLESLKFAKSTPWIKLNRSAKCINNNKETVISDEITFYKSFISNEYSKTEEFKKVKKAITDNYINMVVILP